LHRSEINCKEITLKSDETERARSQSLLQMRDSVSYSLPVHMQRGASRTIKYAERGTNWGFGLGSVLERGLVSFHL